MSFKEEFNKRYAFFIDMLNKLNIKSRYNLSDNDIDEMFYAFLFEKQRYTLIKLRDQRKLNLAISLDIDDLSIKEMV